ncbi:MAG: ral secretion pathway protein [Proteobacteria bacterium]|nr:ral secretion pathway protein [Pseudomonadota bacterium]
MLISTASLRQQGFTLIELIITFAVIAVMITLALPSYNEWIQNSQIRTAAQSITSGMQRARAEAVVRNTPVAFVLGAGGAFWSVSAVNSGELIETHGAGEVSPNVTLTVVSAGGTTVTFGNLGSKVANVPASPDITQIDVDNSALSAANSRDLRIMVGAGGGRLCDPNVADSADPRHC